MSILLSRGLAAVKQLSRTPQMKFSLRLQHNPLKTLCFAQQIRRRLMRTQCPPQLCSFAGKNYCARHGRKISHNFSHGIARQRHIGLDVNFYSMFSSCPVRL